MRQTPPPAVLDKLDADRLIDGTDVDQIVKAPAKLSGIDFSPHDLRQTFITGSTVQVAAGHVRGETTLRQARVVDARRARRVLKYGTGEE